MVIKTKINGSYLESIVPGFTTLYVKGREPLDLDLRSASINSRDGDIYQGRRVKGRTLEILFSLTAATPAAYSTAYNKLKGELYKVKESQLIFDDEPGYYFVGTYETIDVEYTAGQPANGSIFIFCADPFKYSVTETTVTAVNGTITATYNGTYPAHPKLIARSTGHDCGYYGFTKDGITIRVGNPDEQDQEEVPTDTATALIEQNFGSNYSPYTGWLASLARLLYGYKTDSQGVTSATDYIYALPGYPEEPNYYYGPALGTPVPASPNFELSFVNWFEPSGNQGGGFDIYINNSGGGNVCGVSIYRNKNGRVQWYMIVKGNIVKGGSYSLADNPFKGAWRTQTITKSLGTVTFNLGGVAFTVTDPDLASHSYDAANISFVFYRQPGADTIGANNALKSITLRGFANTWQDVANKIPQYGNVAVDTASGRITLNGAEALGLGVITNDFEDFKLEPGENVITCEASDWVDDANYAMTYREAYL